LERPCAGRAPALRERRARSVADLSRQGREAGPPARRPRMRSRALRSAYDRKVGRTRYYTATSLDGVIADPANSPDRLFPRRREADGPLNYDEFSADVGAMAMGATSYEWILAHEFAGKEAAEWKWPYDMPCWVFTHRQLPVVPDARVEFTSAEIAAVHREL